MNVVYGVESTGSTNATGLPEIVETTRAPRTIWTDAQIVQVCDMVGAGKTHEEIALEIGSTRRSILGLTFRLRKSGDPRLPRIKGMIGRLYEIPDDFAAMQEGMSNADLARHYGKALDTIGRWRKRSGLPLRRPANAKREVTSDFILLAPTMTLYAARHYFGTSDATLKRLAMEAGVRFKSPRFVVNRANIAPVDRHDSRDMSPAGMAADYLRKFCAVYRCDSLGHALADGAFWRRGNAYPLTDEEIIERAEHKGWQRDSWRQVAA